MGRTSKKNTGRQKVKPVKKNNPVGAKANTRRGSLEGLNKRKFSKVKQEFHDIDYADQLNDKDKLFLSSFMEEHLGARLNHCGKKHNKSKASKRAIYNQNNARQRDVYSQTKATGRLLDNPETAIQIWQERYMDVNFEEIMLAKEPAQTIMTRREWIRLLDSGADISEEMRIFYMMYYDL